MMPANETYPPCFAFRLRQLPLSYPPPSLYRGIFRVFVNTNNFPLQQRNVDACVKKNNAIEVVTILLISLAFDIVRTFRIDRGVVQHRYYNAFGI